MADGSGARAGRVAAHRPRWRTMVDPAKPDEIDPRQHQRPRAGARIPASRPRTTPSSSASSISAATCGTACSSPWSRRSSRCCSTRWRRSRCRSTGSPAATRVFLLIIATLMIPPTIMLVPNFLVVCEARAAQQPVGRDLARGRDADRRVPAAPVHADDPRRAARRRAHGPRERVAHLLAHRAAAGGARAGGARDLLGDVALERFPVAVDRADRNRAVHAAARAQCVPGRAQSRSGTTCWR